MEERVRRGRREHTADSGALRDLAEFAPERLLNVARDSDWSIWIPAGREALAAAMGTISRNSMAPDDFRIEIVLSLCGDGERKVRDAGYRALVEIERSLLLTHCYAWAHSDSALSRVRAAEASVWIDADAPGNRMAVIAAQLAYDPDRRVREAWRQAKADSRRRSDANNYVLRLLDVGESNADIFHAWPYGRALESIGDDEHLSLLRTAFIQRKVPRHVRSWVYRMLKRLEKELKNRQRKQREEPFFPSAATVHVGSGWLHLQKEEPQQIHYQLWLEAARNPDQLHDWGGAATFYHEPSFHLSPGIDATVELSDGRRGSALLTLVSEGYVALSGNGPFTSAAE